MATAHFSSRIALVRPLQVSRAGVAAQHARRRCLASSSTPPSDPKQAPPGQYNKPEAADSWLTRKIQTSPVVRKLFFGLTYALGYGSPKQVAGRRTYVLYHHLCAGRAEEEWDFWRNECELPPTFQSWFMIANLHVWLLTVRLRALPKQHGMHHIQGLIDHFFQDIEDRIRDVLQPSQTGRSVPIDSFYGNSDKIRRTGRAPERLVTQQMKLFRDQWKGMGFACDMALARGGDAELAAAMWRNLLGARGARGIVFEPSPDALDALDVADPAKVNVVQRPDDGSGIFDYGPTDADRYVAYPELMATLVEYCRRELARLDGISDQDIVDGSVETLQFGPIRLGTIS